LAQAVTAMRRDINGVHYDTAVATWVARVEQDGDLASIIYQMPSGNYFLYRPNGDVIEPMTELEVRRLIIGVIERDRVEDTCKRLFAHLSALGCPLDDRTKQKIINNTHASARKAGLLRTGSPPDLKTLAKRENDGVTRHNRSKDRKDATIPKPNGQKDNC
jgi:hypothetical protein